MATKIEILAILLNLIHISLKIAPKHEIMPNYYNLV